KASEVLTLFLFQRRFRNHDLLDTVVFDQGRDIFYCVDTQSDNIHAIELSIWINEADDQCIAMAAERSCQLASRLADTDDQCRTRIAFVRLGATQKPFCTKTTGRDKYGTQKPVK